MIRITEAIHPEESKPEDQPVKDRHDERELNFKCCKCVNRREELPSLIPNLGGIYGFREHITDCQLYVRYTLNLKLYRDNIGVMKKADRSHPNK